MKMDSRRCKRHWKINCQNGGCIWVKVPSSVEDGTWRRPKAEQMEFNFFEKLKDIGHNEMAGPGWSPAEFKDALYI